MEDFAPFKLAGKLKEKGFNKPCVAYYVSSCSKLYFNIAPLRGNTVEDCLISRNTQVCDVTLADAPTISQVLEWLRDEKDIDLVLEPIIIYIGEKKLKEYSCLIFAPKLNKPKHVDYFESYETAAFAGIEYVLDNLI